MAPPKAESETPRTYDTVNRRLETWTERIKEKYDRTPTDYELLAIDNLPCLPTTQLFDRSTSGIIIYERLRHAEETANPSVLQEAGRLLRLQMTDAWMRDTSANKNFVDAGRGEWAAYSVENSGEGRMNRVFAQQRQIRQGITPVLQYQRAPYTISSPVGASTADGDNTWNRMIMEGHLPLRSTNSNINIHHGDGNRTDIPSTARAQAPVDHHTTPPDVYPVHSSFLPPIPETKSSILITPTPLAAITVPKPPALNPSVLTGTSQPITCPSQSANAKTNPPYPTLRAHSIHGNTYIMPITLHFTNATVSDSSIAVRIPRMASASYPADLVSRERRGDGRKGIGSVHGASTDVEDGDDCEGTGGVGSANDVGNSARCGNRSGSGDLNGEKPIGAAGVVEG